MLLAWHLFFIRLHKCFLVALMWEKDNCRLQGFKLKASAAVQHFTEKAVHMVKMNAWYLSQWLCFCLVLWVLSRPSALLMPHNLSVVCRNKLVILRSEKRYLNLHKATEWRSDLCLSFRRPLLKVGVFQGKLVEQWKGQWECGSAVLSTHTDVTLVSHGLRGNLE